MTGAAGFDTTFLSAQTVPNGMTRFRTTSSCGSSRMFGGRVRWRGRKVATTMSSGNCPTPAPQIKVLVAQASTSPEGAWVFLIVEGGDHPLQKSPRRESGGASVGLPRQTMLASRCISMLRFINAYHRLHAFEARSRRGRIVCTEDVRCRCAFDDRTQDIRPDVRA